MGEGVTVALLAALGTVVTAAVGYRAARHGTSGRVDTTTADTLWEESRSIREELRCDVAALRAEVADLRAKVVECHQENAGYRLRIAALERAL